MQSKPFNTPLRQLKKKPQQINQNPELEFLTIIQNDHLKCSSYLNPHRKTHPFVKFHPWTQSKIHIGLILKLPRNHVKRKQTQPKPSIPNKGKKKKKPTMQQQTWKNAKTASVASTQARPTFTPTNALWKQDPSLNSEDMAFSLLYKRTVSLFLKMGERVS